MALRKFNSHLKSEINTGFGSNSSDYGGRFLAKNGEANIEKRGINLFERISWYHTMLALPRWKFFALIFVFYTAVNICFACVYFLMGVDSLSGTLSDNHMQKFGEAFFFSCQTFTTVGYGRIYPISFIANSISAVEALLGLLSFALVTGLLYGRFSKPKAYLKFSENAVLAPYKDITAIMFRVAPFKNNSLTDAEAKVTLGMAIEEDGKIVNKFFPLSLEFNTVNTLTLSWTLVHPIDEKSPLYKFTKEDYENIRGEILVFVKSFDDMFSNVVVARTSYIFKELIIGAKFNPMYKRSEEGNKTVLFLHKLNSYDSADVSFSFNKEEPAVISGS